MPVSNLGRIGFVTKGDWSAGAYKYLDVVKHKNGSWVCAVPSTEEAPGVSSDWQNLLDQPTVQGFYNWSEMSGQQEPPLIVYHNNDYWMLYEVLSNVADSEPSLSNTSWGMLGTVNPTVGFNDGSTLDGLTFEAVIAAGNYDPTTDTGFFGEVPASVLFTGPQIASAIGLTAGTAQHDNEPWLKFFVGSSANCNRNNGVPYVLYIAKKPYRHSVSWDAIHARGSVYWGQGATVDKGGIILDVGLMFGAYADPANSTNAAPLSTAESCAANHGQGSHWNDLIYRVMSETPSCPSSDTYHGGPQVGGNWASYQNSDLIIGSGNGQYTWCQETSSLVGTYRVHRGNNRLSYLHWNTSSTAYSTYGFRPALRLS